MWVIRASARRGVHASVFLVALVLVFVPSASASHSFTDVPDAHPFHNEIGVFKDTNITAGKTCDPPGTPPTFCPNDLVERQAMAAFFARALGLVVRPNEATLTGVPGSRVAMLDDDLSFVGTLDGALELSHGGVQGLRIEQGDGVRPNLIGGFGGNSVTAGVGGGTIAGGGLAGLINRVTDNGGFVGGGVQNQAGDDAGTTTDRIHATVAGGAGNTASGLGATVPGGFNNVASGQSSFAAGRQAKADDSGAFVWADSQLIDLFSPGQDTFSIRAGGGIWLGTTGAPAIPAGIFLNTSTGGHLTTGGAWTNASDRSLKERFSPVDGQRLLRALVGIPIRGWSYKAEPGVRHLGPVAQDFYRAFRLGGDDRHISTIDADGVALAAIQALHQENRALARENRNLAARLAGLERQMAKLLRAKTH